MSQDCIAWMF